MTEADYHYFRRRASEERTAAKRATHPAARRIHLELADRYEEVSAATAAEVVEFRLLRSA
jgi:hypothetical protein